MKKAVALIVVASALAWFLAVGAPSETPRPSLPSSESDGESDGESDDQEALDPAAEAAPPALEPEPTEPASAPTAVPPRPLPAEPEPEPNRAPAPPEPDEALAEEASPPPLPRPRNTPDELRQRYQSDTRDEAWASKKEASLTAAVERAGATEQVSGIECRSRVCRIELSRPPVESASAASSALATLTNLRKEIGTGPTARFALEGDSVAFYIVREGFGLY